MDAPQQILALDPGTNESALVLINCHDRSVEHHNISPNEVILRQIESLSNTRMARTIRLVVEMVESYGKPVGRETFLTVLWIGRFVQAWAPQRFELVSRRAIKRALCDTERHVTDAVIRQRLIDLYGPEKEKAIGRKAAPGPLYGIRSHEWAALAVGVAFLETQCSVSTPPQGALT